MQPTPRSGANSSSGTLHRFRSAPATWLEALLEGDEEESLKPNLSLSQLLVEEPATTTANQEGSSSFASSSLVEPDLFEPVFLRQNSSPADFLGSSGVDNDAYFSSFAANYEFAAPSVDASLPGKRSREMEVKGEHSEQMPSGGSSLVDVEMEKILEDSVPFKVRAKRGCATHPRSIAERVRRTRISDRIRKLQELVPNMDKQTNTADMLDEAVEYVKFLRRQIEELTEQQRKCQCTAKDQ